MHFDETKEIIYKNKLRTPFENIKTFFFARAVKVINSV